MTEIIWVDIKVSQGLVEAGDQWWWKETHPGSKEVASAEEGPISQGLAVSPV